MLKATRHIFVLMLFLFSISYGVFNASVFLYGNENASRLTTNNFPFENNNYSLISINQKPIFLLKNGEPLEKLEEIRTILQRYYRQTAYPLTEEIAAIKQSIIDYNASLNDGGRFEGLEEDTCRQILLLNGVKYGSSTIYCNSDENCNKIVQILYSATYAKGIKKTISFEETLSLVKEYARASDETRSVISRMLYLIDSINENNLNSSLSEVKSGVSALRRDKAVIENTRFRTPTTDPGEVRRCIDERCFGLCPDFSFNGSQLNLLDNRTGYLLAKSSPYINYQTISIEVHNNTATRFLYKTLETRAVQFSSVFEPLSADAAEAAAQGNVAMSYVSNETLRTGLNRLNDLTNRINTSINRRNFSTIEDDLEQYEKMISDIREIAPKVLETYNRSLEVKNSANAMLFILDAKDLNSRDRKKVDELKNITYNLDARFSEGLPDTQLNEISLFYTNVSNEAGALLKAQKEGVLTFVSAKFRSFSRRINTGVASFISSMKLASPADFISNRLVSLGGLALLVFLSFASLFLFVFISLYYKFKASGGIIKLALVGGYLLFLVGLLVFSALLYILLNKTATAADLEEFVYDLNNKNSSAVVIELQGAAPDSVAGMKTCANSIANNLRAANKTVVTYELDGSMCSVTNQPGSAMSKSRGECNSDIKNSSAFILGYSATPTKPVLSAIYDTKAFFYGDSSYYKYCIIATVFR